MRCASIGKRRLARHHALAQNIAGRRSFSGPPDTHRRFDMRHFVAQRGPCGCGLRSRRFPAPGRQGHALPTALRAKPPPILR
jgi:hypothetical protein